MMNKEHCYLHIYTKKKYFNFDSNSKSFQLASVFWDHTIFNTVILPAKKRMITSKYVTANAIYVGYCYII